MPFRPRFNLVDDVDELLCSSTGCVLSFFHQLKSQVMVIRRQTSKVFGDVEFLGLCRTNLYVVLLEIEEPLAIILQIQGQAGHGGV